jgi:hypothetical protein
MEVKSMTRPMESSVYPYSQPPVRRSGWLHVAMVAAASALAGGLAAAWWYRKTLSKLHQADENVPNTDSWISSGHSADES